MAIEPARQIYQVSALNAAVRGILEDSFPLIWVEGEISNLAQPGSGHWYFSLKDDQAQVRCAMFRNRNQLLRFRPQNGMQVLARAQVSLFEGRGEFQLIIEQLEPAGEGALQRAFEALKRKLQAEGLFDAANKRPLPRWPKRIGVISSPTGAAVRDIISTLKRRWPGLPLLIYPVPAQGSEAAPAMIQALAQANQRQQESVLILARGGGSLEDLWAFNDEGLARAIRASTIPIISGVGHEIDFTIADFAADLRAPTPTAAAELSCPDVTEALQTLRKWEQQALQQMRRKMREQAQQLDFLQRQLLHPGKRILQVQKRLQESLQRLCRLLPQQLLQKRQRLTQNHAALLQQGQRLVALRQQLAQHWMRQLDLVSPLQVLKRGYAIASDSKGRVIHSQQQVRPGDPIHLQVHDGQIDCTVLGTPQTAHNS